MWHLPGLVQEVHVPETLVGRLECMREECRRRKGVASLYNHVTSGTYFTPLFTTRWRLGHLYSHYIIMLPGHSVCSESAIFSPKKKAGLQPPMTPATDVGHSATRRCVRYWKAAHTHYPKLLVFSYKPFIHIFFNLNCSQEMPVTRKRHSLSDWCGHIRMTPRCQLKGTRGGTQNIRRQEDWTIQRW